MRLIPFVVAGLFVGSFVAPGPVLALPEKEISNSYWNGCGSAPEFVDETGVDCWGGHYGTYNGAPAKWKIHYEADCNWPYWTTIIYSEWCASTSSWKIVSAADFNAGNCSCS